MEAQFNSPALFPCCSWPLNDIIGINRRIIRNQWRATMKGTNRGIYRASLKGTNKAILSYPVLFYLILSYPILSYSILCYIHPTWPSYSCRVFVIMSFANFDGMRQPNRIVTVTTCFSESSRPEGSISIIKCPEA